MKRYQPAVGFVLVTLFLDILGIGLLIPILPRLVESFTGGDVSNASTIYGVLAPIHLPGAAFFLGAFLIVCALLLALRSFRRHPTPGSRDASAGS